MSSEKTSKNAEETATTNSDAQTGADTTPTNNSAATPLGLIGAVRSAIAGVLMGIANLIPGVSGGTMILAMGVYEEFIDSVADVTALRLSVRRVMFLGIVGLFAVGSILGLAGVILYLLFHYPEAMFALFIGLTLGGAPLLARSLKPVRADVVVSVTLGFLAMVGIAMLKADRGFPHNAAMDFASGIVGSTTMVLPGISGSYMLLVLDQYDRVVGAVRDLKEGLTGRDFTAIKQALYIVVPVGIGAVLGIVGLSNILKILLHRYHRPTVGALLGILLGSVIGLWPFGRVPAEKALERCTPTELRAFAEKQGIPESDAIADDALVMHIREHWDQRGTPDYAPGTVVLAMVLVAVGFAGTFTLARMKPDDA